MSDTDGEILNAKYTELEVRAEKIIEEDRERYLNWAIDGTPLDEFDEIQIEAFIWDYLHTEPREYTDRLVRRVLLKYMNEEKPFPVGHSKRGRKRIDIRSATFLYIFRETKSVNRTAKLLNVDRKTVKDRVPENIRKWIVSGTNEKALQKIDALLNGQDIKQLEQEFINAQKALGK